MKELKSTFRPEFINRIDEIIIFNTLSKEVIYDIIDKLIEEIEKRLDDKKVKLILTDKAKTFIVDNSYDDKFGARPIKRFISHNIETLIATEIINDNIKYNSTVTIDIEDNKIVVK
jgi:ATP-dependent Clp protease ATP-binding subunit ClpB